MVASVSFQTRARTIDHLGREQIADCPTAVSELWKNAYDAYARNVCLNIFDGESPVATLVDDGHGMTIKDLREKWLIVGTESKATNATIQPSEMNGLTLRPKQGQKGIGRLSCAALGSLLLLISKHKHSPFVACLLDWRLFENPFLMLHDIELPIVEFDTSNQIIDHLPAMFDRLMGNLWGDGLNIDRDSRITAAWDEFEAQELAAEIEKTTKQKIEETVINEAFTIRHFESWAVWNNESAHGTAMIMGAIHEDLVSQLSLDAGSEGDGTEVRAKDTFKQTLSNFINPFARVDENQITDFVTSVVCWNGSLQRYIIDKVSEFGIQQFDDLEHIVEGEVDHLGVFSGQIRAFGKWHENITIKPKATYKLRKDTLFGPFKLRIGSYEGLRAKTTHSDELFNMYMSQSALYGGVMVHRDSLRVMPYGREDNDFFEIEKRRTKNAGDYFFSNRRSFGGVSISKLNNPNLRDKAGREGIIDNKASKLFREIVEHILIQAATRFLGAKSTIRTETLEAIAQEKAIEKASQDRRKLLRNEQMRVKKALNKNEPTLLVVSNDIKAIATQIAAQDSLTSVDFITRLKMQVGKLDSELKELSLSPIPKSLGSIENAYRRYRDIELAAKSLIKQLDQSLNVALSRIIVKSDIETAESLFKSKAGFLHARIRKLATEGRKKLRQEQERFEQVVDRQNKAYHLALADSLADLAAGHTTLNNVIEQIDHEYQKQDIENNQILMPYLTALENIANQIDLEGLALHSVNEATSLKQEVERLNGLAQLGITVEIIGHEIEGFDMTIERGLEVLSRASLNTHERTAYNSIITAQNSLSDRWRFLSPLKLSGDKVRVKLLGNDIFTYVNGFYKEKLLAKGILFHQTDSFKRLSIIEQPARLYPVFINIINNARYWVTKGDAHRPEIILDFKDGEVYISDNGPGVDIDDIPSLFTIFFTRKQRGGRGVGLYLCKTNLQAGNHTIRYETNNDKKILAGANFVLGLKGVKHD